MLFRLCWQYLRRHLGVVTIILICQLLSVIAGLFLPDVNARIIDDGVIQGRISLIWSLGGIMLAFAVFQAITMVVAIVLAARLSMGIGRWLRKEQFLNASNFSATQLSSFGPSSLITRNSNDVQQIQQVVLVAFAMLLAAPIMGIGAVVMALRQNRHLSLLLLVMVPLLGAFVGWLMHRLHPLFQAQQTRIDRINTLFREQLAGVRVIRAFVRQRDHQTKFADANAQLRSVALAVGRSFALLFAGVQSIVWVSQVAVIWFGGHLIADHSMQVGALIAFNNYLMQIFMSVMMATRIFVMIPRASVSAKRIHDVITTSPELHEPAEPLPVPDRVEFELEQVTVQLDEAERPILNGINLVLGRGTTTGIIGPTGSGKSVLVNLLPRLFDVTSGTVLVNGADIRNYAIDDIRSRIALVPQTAYLFSGTIASTVSGHYRPDAIDRDRVWRAIEGAQAAEFVEKLDGGIDSEVEAGGRNLSGGQRQRLAIARALYRSADLYIFDDSLSALDATTEQKLRAALPEYTLDAAVVIVSQKLSSIINCDQIMVLDAGEVAGLGTHEELMATCALYREIVEPQMGVAA